MRFAVDTGMYFRFGSALILVVLISLAGTSLEKRSLELRRAVSRQQYRLEVLLEQHAARRVQAQQLGAPLRVIETFDEAEFLPANPAPPARSKQQGNPKTRKKPRSTAFLPVPHAAPPIIR